MVAPAAISDSATAFDERQRQVLGYTISEVRHQLRTEIAQLAARLAKLEQLVGTSDDKEGTNADR